MADSSNHKPLEINAGAAAPAPPDVDNEMAARPPQTHPEMAQVIAELRDDVAESERTAKLYKDSEARLHLALEAAGMATWDWDIVNDVLQYSPQVGPMLGLPPGSFKPNHQTFLSIVHEEDRRRFEHEIEQALKGEADYGLEFRIIWPDGSAHWIASRGLVLRNPAGEPERMIGVVMDITERKEAEQSRHHLLNCIVAAQEEERRRVSRELHDQMGQNLAALIVGLEALKSECACGGPARNRLRWLQELANRLSQEVHSLAWELRPPVLDDFGLPMALERYVQQWSARGDVAVDWHASGFTARRLPAAVETTLYRVVQEALTNVLKHAQATRISLILRAAADSVLAIIEDNGRGFDADAMRRAVVPHDRLGLIGMRERVLLVNGTLNIESLPGQGTTVYVRIPLAEDG